MAPERNLRPHEAQWVVQSLARCALTVGFALALLIILGGRGRWSSPSFEAALTYPYAPASWGYVLGVTSTLGLIASLAGGYRTVSAALYIVAVWSLFFAWSFFSTARLNPEAATTGIPMYIGYAVSAIVLGVAHWRSSRDAVHG